MSTQWVVPMLFTDSRGDGVNCAVGSSSSCSIRRIVRAIRSAEGSSAGISASKLRISSAASRRFSNFPLAGRANTISTNDVLLPASGRSSNRSTACRSSALRRLDIKVPVQLTPTAPLPQTDKMSSPQPDSRCPKHLQMRSDRKQDMFYVLQPRLGGHKQMTALFLLRHHPRVVRRFPTICKMCHSRVQTRFHGSQRNFEDVADLLVGKLVKIGQ